MGRNGLCFDYSVSDLLTQRSHNRQVTSYRAISGSLHIHLSIEGQYDQHTLLRGNLDLILIRERIKNQESTYPEEIGASNLHDKKRLVLPSRCGNLRPKGC